MIADVPPRVARILRFTVLGVKISPNEKSRSALPYADRLFDLLGNLSAPRFRSVLSHWVYRCELEGLYTKQRPARNSLPGRPSLLQILRNPYGLASIAARAEFALRKWFDR